MVKKEKRRKKTSEISQQKKIKKEAEYVNSHSSMARGEGGANT
jgi:hypothetical protein